MTEKHANLKSEMDKAYPNVPITRVVTKLEPDPKTLASPKSDTLGFHCLSRRMLLDLMSRCTTLGSKPSCKYAILQTNNHFKRKTKSLQFLKEDSLKTTKHHELEKHHNFFNVASQK